MPVLCIPVAPERGCLVRRNGANLGVEECQLFSQNLGRNLMDNAFGWTVGSS